MTIFKVTEEIIGRYPEMSAKEKAVDLLLWILTSPIRLLTLLNKGYKTLNNSPWEYMFTDDKLKIEKRLIATTGFDDCILFYSLSSSDKNLNDFIRNKYFSDFLIKLDSGILLRQFNSPADWPNSVLVYISLDSYQTETILKSKSSWTHWEYSMKDSGHIEIITEQEPGYKKVISLRLK